MTVQEWLGKNNQIGIDIWEKKYRYNNEGFDEWLDRVSGRDEELRQLILNKRFLFAGRTLANRGTSKKGSYANCYSEGYVLDSLENIMQVNTNIAHTFKAQGGQGLSLSKLRPKGCGINNGQFKSDGIIPFMEMFNRTTESISQGGSRKGALIMTLDIWHKEAKNFITIKSEENKIQKANLSLEIDDEFMECVKKYYKTGEVIKKLIKKNYNGNIVEYEVVPIDLYKLMMEKAYNWAEPGCLFINRFRNYNLMEFHDGYEIETCNPCFAGNMELLTADGYKTFEELSDTEPYIFNVDGNVVKSKVWCSGEKDTVQVKTTNGTIICTADHRFMTKDGEECVANNLKGKYLMPISSGNRELDKKYIKYGFIQGDGQLSRLNSVYHEGLEVNIGEKDGDIRELFSDENFTYKSNRAIYLDGFKDDLINLGFSRENLPTRIFPSTYPQWTHNQKASFLHGCYSANGSVIKKGRVSYKTTCREFAEQLMKTLTNDFNIKDVYITTNKSKKNKFTNGEYECRESYDINIGKFKEITKFVTEINFYQAYKREQLSQLMNRKTPYVTSVTPYKKIKVYDFKESERHWGIVEGFVVHNCGEQALPKSGACNLGSINLSEFVIYPFTKSAYFDFENFEKAIRIAVKALDTIVDENLKNHPLLEQQSISRNYRNIGLGIMGMWDMLVKLGYKYGSKKSIHFVDYLMREMFRQAVFASGQLAKEKGSFPKYDKNVLESSITKKHFTFTQRELDDLEITKYGLRNCSLLSVAPTGSLGTMLNVSTGCEPAFSIAYNRKTESLNGGEDTYYKVYTGAAKEYLEAYPDKELPEAFVTSGDIHWKDRIDMQAIIQEHVDTAISSTVNLPNNCTQEEIEDLYLYAWEKGLKGVTIYRDGCKRSGILSTETTDKNRPEEDKLTKQKQEIPRGMIIKADDNCVGKKRTLHTGCGTLHCEAFFDPDTGELLETYFSKGSSGGCNNFMIGLSRMISLSSRAGVDIDSIIDQLKSSGVCPSYAVRTATKRDTSKGSCCPVAIGNALMEMYKEMRYELGIEGEEKSIDPNKTIADSMTGLSIPVDKIKTNKISVSSTCPQCGEPLIFEGGCNICKNCGWSKCD